MPPNDKEGKENNSTHHLKHQLPFKVDMYLKILTDDDDEQFHISS